MAIVTGIEKLYVALLTKDDASGLTYSTPKLYPGVQEIGVKPKTNTAKGYAENKLWAQAIAFDSCDVDINMIDLTSAERAELLGQTLATEGGVYASSTDKAPYVAILYKASTTTGFRYGIFYKGMFALPEDSIKGQEGKIDYQSAKISATFAPTINNGMWQYFVDSDDPDCPANIDTTWFTAVKQPTKKTV